MPISDELTDKFQQLLNTKYGANYSFEEARSAGESLVEFVEFLYKLKLEDDARMERLKDEPKGFALTDGTYSCGICGTYTSPENTWYDKFGIKCLICQRAIDKRKVPGSVCHDHDSWYSTWELDNYFGIKHQTVRKLVRLGKLKARIVENDSGKPYCYVFLIKDNPGVLGTKPKPITKQNENGSFSVEYPKQTPLNI